MGSAACCLTTDVLHKIVMYVSVPLFWALAFAFAASPTLRCSYSVSQQPSASEAVVVCQKYLNIYDVT